MDIKTLEYMRERVEKGNEILKKIEELKQDIRGVQRVYSIKINSNGTSTYLTLPKSCETNPGIAFTTKAVAILSNTYIDIANAEIRQLEQEFAEL